MEKDYKQNLIVNNMGKRGQVAIFVIIAVVVVAAIVLIFYFRGEGIVFFAPTELKPISFLKDCVEPEIMDTMDILSKNGGYIDPQGTVEYQGEEIKYLCYSSEYYQPCVVQQPLIKENYENQLASVVLRKAEQCARNLVREYESRGYDVDVGDIDTNITIVLDNVRVDFIAPMTVTKEETTRTFDGFEVEIPSKMYEILMISTSIIDFETTYGDSETSLYLDSYPDIKIEKTTLGDGTTIYVVSNVITEESFRFASRSLAWPPGYGID